MSAPEPIRLADGEDLYRAGDLPTDGTWEAKFPGNYEWQDPDYYRPTEIVIARRKPWVPQPGDRVVVVQGYGTAGTVVEPPSDQVWVNWDDCVEPHPYPVSSLRLAEGPS